VHGWFAVFVRDTIYYAYLYRNAIWIPWNHWKTMRIHGIPQFSMGLCNLCMGFFWACYWTYGVHTMKPGYIKHHTGISLVPWNSVRLYWIQWCPVQSLWTLITSSVKNRAIYLRCFNVRRALQGAVSESYNFQHRPSQR